MSLVTDQIVAEAQRQGVDPALAIEVARAESGLDPNTPDSSAGAIGLFQLEPATAAALGVNPRDPVQNMQGGIRYLGQLLAQFGSIAGALAAYDWGPGHLSQAIAKWGASWTQHLPSETANYIAKITRALSQYTAKVTPASIANGVTQLFTSATPPAPDVSDQSTPVAAAPARLGTDALVSIAILAALGLGAYLVSEALSD